MVVHCCCHCPYYATTAAVLAPVATAPTIATAAAPCCQVPTRLSPTSGSGQSGPVPPGACMGRNTCGPPGTGVGPKWHSHVLLLPPCSCPRTATLLLLPPLLVASNYSSFCREAKMGANQWGPTSVGRMSDCLVCVARQHSANTQEATRNALVKIVLGG